MNILFLISSFAEGRGGHFYDLKTIAQEVAETNRISVMSVGTSESPALKSFPGYEAVTSGFPTPRVLLRLLKRIRQGQIDVIHTFDNASYFFARLASLISGVPVLHSKCGGPLPRRYYPAVLQLVVYSAEDHRYFLTRAGGCRTRIHLIPNRTRQTRQDREAISDILQQLNSRGRVILRIARFTKAYEKSFLDVARLGARLQKDGVPVRLVLIGTITDQNTYHVVKEALPPNALILTNDIYTINASRLIDVADLVVGTGRGTMEAAMHGKVLLGTTKNLDYPALIDERNIAAFAERNFSPRVTIDTSNELEYARVKATLLSPRKIDTLSTFSSDYASQHFDASLIRDRYLTLYASADRCKASCLDIALHAYITIREYWAAPIKSKVGA